MQPDKQQIEKNFKAAIEKANEGLKSTHTKKEYTFTNEEKIRLSRQALVQKIAASTLEDIVNLDVLPRVGINPTPEVFSLYDIDLGRLTVWTPITPAKNKAEETDTTTKE